MNKTGLGVIGLVFSTVISTSYGAAQTHGQPKKRLPLKNLMALNTCVESFNRFMGINPPNTPTLNYIDNLGNGAQNKLVLVNKTTEVPAKTQGDKPQKIPTIDAFSNYGSQTFLTPNISTLYQYAPTAKDEFWKGFELPKFDEEGYPIKSVLDTVYLQHGSKDRASALIFADSKSEYLKDLLASGEGYNFNYTKKTTITPVNVGFSGDEDQKKSRLYYRDEFVKFLAEFQKKYKKDLPALEKYEKELTRLQKEMDAIEAQAQKFVDEMNKIAGWEIAILDSSVDCDNQPYLTLNLGWGDTSEALIEQLESPLSLLSLEQKKKVEELMDKVDLFITNDDEGDYLAPYNQWASDYSSLKEEMDEKEISRIDDYAYSLHGCKSAVDAVTPHDKEKELAPVKKILDELYALIGPPPPEPIYDDYDNKDPPPPATLKQQCEPASAKARRPLQKLRSR